MLYDLGTGCNRGWERTIHDGTFWRRHMDGADEPIIVENVRCQHGLNGIHGRSVADVESSINSGVPLLGRSAFEIHMDFIVFNG